MTEEAEIEKLLLDPVWRISNLYKIVVKKGKILPFRPNEAQRKLLRWVFELKLKRILILKARQIGFSTVIEIIALDKALFSKNQQISIIADTDENAKKLLSRMVKFAYEKLDPDFKIGAGDLVNNVKSLSLENGCTIHASTRARSGTFQFMHISELGKISHKDPERAKEIKTGALPSVPPTGQIFIESTFEGGKGGLFYDMIKTAMETPDEHKTDLDYHFLFFPWFDDPGNVIDGDFSQIDDERWEYFNELEESLKIDLSFEQRLWYYKTKQILGDDMQKEYPSTPEEAFEVKVSGAYYDKEMSKMRAEGRICPVPHDPAVPMFTFWDLGMSDYMCIWFIQFVGREIHATNYYENEGEGFPFYKKILDQYQKDTNCVYGGHYAPHDIKVRELLSDGISRLEGALKIGIEFTEVSSDKVDIGIREVRNILGRTLMDKDKCSHGINCLESYHKRTDEKNNIFWPVPVHDWSSHCADAKRTLAMALAKGLISNQILDNQRLRNLPTSIPSNFQ